MARASIVPTSLILLGGALLYVFFYYPVGYVILTVALGVIAFLINRDYVTPLGIVVIMIFIRTLGDVLTPKPKPAKPYAEDFQTAQKVTANAVSKEGFQAKDPISIHQRIVKQRTEVPRVSNVTGVLESPEILDSLHVGQVAPGEEGFTNSVQPAALNQQPTAMATPAESSMPRMPSPDAAPMANPYLQNGPDRAGEATALVNKGTALTGAEPAGNMAATTTGAAPFE